MVDLPQLRALILSFFLSLGCCTNGLIAFASPQNSQLAATNLTTLLPSEPEQVYDATVTFITENTLVLQLCHLTYCPLITVLQTHDGAFRTLARREIPAGRVRLFKAVDNGILAISMQESSKLFSTDLSMEREYSYHFSYVSPSGKTAAAYAPVNQWTIYRISASPGPLEETRRIVGDLEAIADDSVVIRDHDMMRVETMKGALIGAFKVKPKNKCATELQSAGQGKLFIRSCFHDQIIDMNGKELTRLKSPDGWGIGTRESADGRRILYDRYIRVIPALQRFGEVFAAVATLGVGAVDEVDTGEAVRVVDTATGKRCFDWKDPKHLAGTGTYHADISPSGGLVAVVSMNTLHLYRLPDNCSK